MAGKPGGCVGSVVLVMAQVIEFSFPTRFKPKVKWIPVEQRGKITRLPPTGHFFFFRVPSSGYVFVVVASAMSDRLLPVFGSGAGLLCVGGA